MNISDKIVLLIDNSNTRTKFVFVEDGKMAASVFVLPTSELTPQRIADTLPTARQIDYAVVCSVVPACRAVFEAAFACPIHFLSAESPMDMEFDYAGTATLGADRIANALAVCNRYDTPCIVIDAGTAVTFDVVVNKGGKSVYVGGAIAPGMRAFADYMHRCTAQLPAVDTVVSRACIGKNTPQAMQAGVTFGFAGMVNGIVAQLETELACPAPLILTGGDGERLLRGALKHASYDKYLTFSGLLHVLHAL